jgi:diguanylate cyclase (GGDEF)-like protein
MVAARASALIAGRALRLYLVVSVAWIAAYLVVPSEAQPVVFLGAALGAVPCVAHGLTDAQPGKRAPWWLLLSALSVLSIGLVLRIVDGEAEAAGVLLNAAGNALLFAAAVAMVMRCGRTDVGGVIDASIVGLALGGVLCIIMFALADIVDTAARVNLFVVLFALSGVLGALIRLAMVLTQPVAALWWLMFGLGLALVANVIQAGSTSMWAADASGSLFMAAYTSVGAFGLHPTAGRLLRPGFVNRDDSLTDGRLVFLGVAVAVVPAIAGTLMLLGRSTPRDGAVLLVGTALITALVVIRVGRMSADRSRIEQALRQQATVDPLTGLPNRRTFLDRLSSALESRRRCAVLFCDIDGFKPVNDTWGHSVGDELLAQVGDRLVSSVRGTDTVSRFGGDEFVILLVGADPTSVDAIIERIRGAFAAPFPLSSGPVTLGLSIGLAAGTVGNADDLVREADGLMYEAKRARGATPSVRIAA